VSDHNGKSASQIRNGKIYECRRDQTDRVSLPSYEAMLMPRYFFSTRIGPDLISDPKGTDLRDPDHAWELARTMILEILRDQRGQPNLLTAILEVTDEHGEVVLAFPFSEALNPLPDEPPTKH
jgi:hypothetical protein